MQECGRNEYCQVATNNLSRTHATPTKIAPALTAETLVSSLNFAFFSANSQISTQMSACGGYSLLNCHIIFNCQPHIKINISQQEQSNGLF